MTKAPNSQGRELYDLIADPDENMNLESLPEYAEVVAYLSDLLHAGWQESGECSGGLNGCVTHCPSTPDFAADDCVADCHLACGE